MSKKNDKTKNQNSEKQTVKNEFCALSNSIALSQRYFGMNIFDLYSPKIMSELVKDPMYHNQTLRNVSLMLYGMNGTFTNTTDYMVAMPTLDRVIVTHGKSARKKKKNKEIMDSVLRAIKEKEIIRDALFRGIVEGIAFYYFETTPLPSGNQKTMSDFDIANICEINELGFNASVIPLPTDYTRIVSIKNSSYVIAFNLDYFDKIGSEEAKTKIRKYPKEIREAYAKRASGSTSPNNWIVLDSNKTIVHKIRSKRTEIWGRPLALAAIDDIMYGNYFTDTKRNVLDEINNKIIYQTFPEGKDKGSSALTKNQQEAQHEAVKGAVMNKNNRGGVSFISIAAGTKINALDASNTDIFDDKYESNLNDKIALDLGIAGSLLNGVGSGTYASQMSNLELISAQLFQWIEQIEAELNKCISRNIIQDSKNWVECKYLPITHVNKKEMVQHAKELYLQGCGSLSLWSAACGVSPDIFFALLDQEKEDNVYEKYQPHQTSYTLSKNEKAAGRPMTDNPSESTIASRGNNGNNIPSPSDKK